MRESVVLLLPFPPSANGLFRNVPGKGRVRTDAYRRWQHEAGCAILIARPRPRHIAGPYRIHLCLARDRRGRSDADNRMKAVGDLLVMHGIVEDDRLAEEVRISWGDVAGCRVEIVRASSEIQGSRMPRENEPAEALQRSAGQASRPEPNLANESPAT